MRIHIEGMGILGSLVALTLAGKKIPFTWHDTNEKQVAWQASTGAIYPAGADGSVDKECYDAFANMLGHSAYALLAKHCEFSWYVFNHKKPPHDGRYDFNPIGNYGLNIGDSLSMHLNAQTFVPAVRERFKSKRLRDRPTDTKGIDFYIVAHGFPSAASQRTSHYYWGWTRLVQLKYDKRLLPQQPNKRPCFYFRQGRFVMAYAYPVPGTPWWYSGSSLIVQRERKSLDMPAKYERWKAFFEKLGGGYVKVAKEGEYLEGWRPARSDDKWVTSTGRTNKVISLPPLWNSGIRHSPKVIAQLIEQLGV